MGGLACAKEAIDQRAATRASVQRSLATVDRVMDCFATTVMLAGEKMTDEPEDAFIEAANNFRSAISDVSETFVAKITEIEAQVRATWEGPPQKGGGKGEGL